MTYDAKSIKTLDPLEHIRTRPGMYIGETKNPGHLFQEILDNSVDEFLTGNCNHIYIKIDGDIFTIKDNGRGIPVGRNEKGVAAEQVFTQLFSGGKFSRGDGYSVSAGLHGVGLSAVAALSEYVKVDIERDGFLHHMVIRQGKLTQPLHKVEPSNNTGTQICFKADSIIFDNLFIPLNEIKNKISNLTLLLKGLTITYNENGREQVFKSKGIEEFVEKLFENMSEDDESLQRLHEKPLTLNETIPLTYVNKGVEYKGIFSVDWCCLFTNSSDPAFRSFVNCIRTRDGGTHVNAYRKLLYKTVKALPEAKGKNFLLEDLVECTIAVLSIRTSDVSFTSQTKEKFNAKSATNAIIEAMGFALKELLKDKDLATAIIEQAVAKRAAKEKSRSLIEQQKRLMTHGKKIRRNAIPGLVDCTSTNVEETELFLLEGGSAAGTVRQSRNPKTQAVLALKGKIINAQRTKITTTLKVAEVRRIVDSVGCGILEDCKPEKSRYGKILILTDADPDGEHIAACIITLFHILMRPIIDAEMLYIVNTPLFMASNHKGQRVFAKTSEEIKAKTSRGKKNWRITRMKGWGEANVSDMKKIAMLEEHRELITIEPTSRDVQAVKSIMGSDSSFRKLLVKNDMEDS